MNKYRNKKTTIDGIQFDSKLEADRYCFLKMMEKAGKISELRLQPKFLLTDAFSHNGKKYRPMYYIADFQYVNLVGRIIIEDTKGLKVSPYPEKLKVFLSKWAPSIKFAFYEIYKHDDDGGIV